MSGGRAEAGVKDGQVVVGLVRLVVEVDADGGLGGGTDIGL